jgi:hypothetical protein
LFGEKVFSEIQKVNKEGDFKKSMDSQLNKYHKNAMYDLSSWFRSKYSNLVDSQKSNEWSKSLQYKVPINTSQNDKTIRTSKDSTSKKRKKNNVFALRNHGMITKLHI